MRIRYVEAIHVRIPLERPYVISRGSMTAFDSVIVRMTTEDGLVGYGESVPLSIVGDAAAMARQINGPLRAVFVGADPFDMEALLTSALETPGHDVDTVAGLDMALWDLIGKGVDQPAYRLLGGLCQDPIPIDFTIGAAEPPAMVDAALHAVRDGYAGVVVKVPCVSVAEDIARVRTVRASVPASHSVRVDCNGGYSRTEAFNFLRAIAELKLEFVEQPVAGEDVEGMRRCREFGIPLSVDEGLNTARDALALVQQRACDVFNIKVPKVGGLMLAKRIAAIAAAAEVPIVVGGRTTLEISRSASRHFAASTKASCGRAHEGPGPASQALRDDVTHRRTARHTLALNGGVRVEQAPGLGIDVAWDKVQTYTVPE